MQKLVESREGLDADMLVTSAGVSTERAVSGTKALKVTNKHFAECRLSGQFTPADDFWVRAYMYWGTELELTSRETLAMDLTPGAWVADDSHAIRFGYLQGSSPEGRRRPGGVVHAVRRAAERA